MVETLQQVAVESRENNIYVGIGQVDALKQDIASLDPAAPLSRRWQLPMMLGVHELRVGRTEDAISSFERARELLEGIADPSVRPWRLESLYRLGVAHLRLGETQNCALRHTADSCLLPIRGEGVHVDPRGSEGAVRYFTLVLEAGDAAGRMRLKSLWLLNIAYMTLGRYPHGVPSRWLIPEDVFAADEEFPRLTDIAPRLGLNVFDLSGGGIVDDFNGDGRLDILVSTLDPEGGMHYFRNDGDGSFTDRVEEAGLEGLTGGLNMVHADYDNDGDLDLYIGNESSRALEAPSQLFRNQGDGTFVDVASTAGVENLRYAKGVGWGDYDDDGFPDLYVSNIGDDNRLYRNNGDGTFADVAAGLGVTGPITSFPAWFWDFDNDGVLDIFVAAYGGDEFTDVADIAASYLDLPTRAERMHLYRGDGRGGFEEVAASRNLTRITFPMGANFGDLDGDGYLDMYLGTGYTNYEALMPNLMYLNRGGRRFVDVTASAGLGHLQKGHGVAFADLDNDGDQDLFEQIGGAYPGDAFGNALFENPGFGNHWIKIKLVGGESNRSGIGARIRLDFVDAGSVRSAYRHVGSGGSFGGNPFTQEIGIGRATGIERLEVFWPASGTTQVFEDVAVDQRIEIEEGQNRLKVF